MATMTIHAVGGNTSVAPSALGNEGEGASSPGCPLRSTSWVRLAACCILAGLLTLTALACGKAGSGPDTNQEELEVEVTRVAHPPDSRRNEHYVGNRPPLKVRPLVTLPIDSISPGGWLKKKLQLEADGYTGRLEEISLFLREENSAWRSPEGKGKHGWEEVPYWLRGYVPLAYLLDEEDMIENARDWLEPIIRSGRSDGWFGPRSNLKKSGGSPDIMPNMFVQYALEDYYEETGDERVIELLLDFCRFIKDMPKNELLTGAWEKKRGVEQLHHVYWLYNRTGKKWLLDVAKKIQQRSIPWTKGGLVDDHAVNIGEGVRHPATYWQQSHRRDHLRASYGIYEELYDNYAMPGKSYPACDYLDDPQARKGLEACAMAEHVLSGAKLFGITGDAMWADHAGEMAFNSFSAATSWDMKALRYHTSPNMPASDNLLKTPIFTWHGWMKLSGTWMNPHAHRCCQHNTGMGWPNYAKHTWFATSDNGLATGLFGPSSVRAQVGQGREVEVTEKTRYPFREEIRFSVSTPEPVNFPLYLRIPSWCGNPQVSLNGAVLDAEPDSGQFVRISRTWRSGDRVVLNLPMDIRVTTWEKLRGAVSVRRGPLTYSLKIEPRREETTDYDWSNEARNFADRHGVPVERFAGTEKWPAYNMYPDTAWNYGLIVEEDNPAETFEVEMREWPKSNTPFRLEDTPIAIKARAKRLPGWELEEHNLTEVLPPSPLKSSQPAETVTLVPMGAARLRLCAFPRIGSGPDAYNWEMLEMKETRVSYCNPANTPRALDDATLPDSSIDLSIPRFTWWDHKGSMEWVEYRFDEPVTISSSRVYWFDDRGKGECRVPASWKLLYREDGEWKPVRGVKNYGTARDRFNEVDFQPVETKAVRLQVQLRDGYSGGILEWQVTTGG